ncbi:hypothetical protein F4604DRAFT_1956917 [Suillus subluteus]|nr:hypothetical protein F4604DRAFT_1956917 [Suillus subluteus]
MAKTWCALPRNAMHYSWGGSLFRFQVPTESFSPGPIDSSAVTFYWCYHSLGGQFQILGDAVFRRDVYAIFDVGHTRVDFVDLA